MKRTDRVGAIIQILSQHPNKVYSLAYFCNLFGAAKSSVSEDVSMAKDLLERTELGRIETIAGAKGGVRFISCISESSAKALLEELRERLSDGSRILGGGFFYTSDLMFDSNLVQGAARIFADHFQNQGADYVATIETKGIPAALMTAHMLNLPLVVVRRESKVSEGSTISINYISGSSERIQKISLSKRAVVQGSKAIIIDDFMRAGGSVRGVQDILKEFDVETVGIGVMIAAKSPERKKVQNFFPLIYLGEVDEENRTLELSINEEIFSQGNKWNDVT